MSTIVNVKARQILDSRGNPTLEVEVYLSDGSVGRSAVPSGASTGAHEALELRDKGKEYRGMSVLKAVHNVEEIIAPAIVGMDGENQAEVDQRLIELDGTKNKSRLGANAMLGVSMAVARAEALSHGLSLYRYLGGIARMLPVPFMNVLNGGKHADNNLDIQEFMIVPAGAASFSEALRMGSEVYHSLKNVLKEKGYSTAVGDEGGFAPRLGSNQEALELLTKAIEEAGYRPGEHVYLAIDAAASEFYKDGGYRLEGEGWEGDAADLVRKYAGWVSKFPVVSIEDGLSEDDWEGWRHLNEELGARIQVIGDDLFVTSKERILEGIARKAANSVLIKVNQVGTVTETLEAIEVARLHGMRWMISHRSGETEDTFIADLAVATGAGQIKSGAPARTERVAKYNQLLRIEEELSAGATLGTAVTLLGLR